MPAGPRPQRQATDDWEQLRLLVTSPEQAIYEILRPVVLFGQSARSRARETGIPERSLRRKAARFAAVGMRSLFESEPEPVRDRRRLPAAIRRAIVELKAEYPPFSLRELAAICRERFDHPVDHHTVKQVLLTEPLPLRLPRRFRRYHEIADPVERRKAIVELYLEGWSARSIAGYLATSRARVYETLHRWVAEGLPGLADRSRAPHRPARKVDLKAMVAIRRLQANPELGEFRIHAALAQQGIRLSPRTCGRILALHRALGAPQPAAATPREPQPMPFAAQRRHQYWSVDIRYIEDHSLGTGKPVYVISILENFRDGSMECDGLNSPTIFVANQPFAFVRRESAAAKLRGAVRLSQPLNHRLNHAFSRAILASAVSPRQDLTAFLIVLRAAVEAHGAPEVLVSDGGGVFRATQAKAVSRALGIEKAEIDQGQAWQNYVETHFNVMRRMADYHYARATTWAELQAVHDRFFHDYNHQPHAAHQARTDGRRSLAAVLGWVRGAWCDPADLDRLFRLRATRVLNAGGYLRFRHWRLYGERGLAGERVAVWVWDETVTVEWRATPWPSTG